MLKIASFTVFTVCDLLRENKQGCKITHPPTQPTQIRARISKTTTFDWLPEK